MGSLIDADDVISLLANHHFYDSKENTDLLIHNLCKEVKSVPTAFDPDRVVEQLEAYSNEEEAERLGTIPVVELADAIEIVKGGGVDGN